MAEFCLDCFNEYFADEKVTEADVLMEEDLCEGCGEWKPCVIRLRRRSPFSSVVGAVRSIIKMFRKSKKEQ